MLKLINIRIIMIEILIFSVMVIGSIFGLLGFSMNLLWSTTRCINLAFGEFLMLGSYITYFSYTLFGIDPLISIPISALVIGAMGVILYKLVLERLIFRVERTESASIILFFAMSIIIQNIASLVFGSETRGYAYLTTSVNLFGMSFALIRLVILVVISLLFLGILILFSWTTFGKTVKALMENRDAGQLVGVNPYSTLLICTFISFACAGAVGSLISMIYEITPFIGFFYTMLAFIIVIITGLGKMAGCMFAGLVLGFVYLGVGQLISLGVGSTAVFVIFILLLFFKPTGIFGGKDH